MIYLFDDSPNRGIDPVDFTDCLCLVQCLSGDGLIRMRASLETADCILMHRSFRDEGGRTAEICEQVIDEIASYGDNIPLVIFSDGDMAGKPEMENDRFVSAIKKSEMYHRLPAFLESFRLNRKVELILLAKGESSDVLAAITIGKRVLDNSCIRFLTDNTAVPEELLSIPELGGFLNYSRPEIGVDYKCLSDAIKGGTLSVGKLRYNFRRSINDFVAYGRNLHHWE